MLKFFYDSLETLQKVKFATKKDYISLGLGVIFAIIVCGAFFIAVDTVLSGAYKTFYSIMKSDTLEDQIFDDTTVVSGAIDTLTGTDVSTGDAISTGDVVSTGIIVTPSTGS